MRRHINRVKRWLRIGVFTPWFDVQEKVAFREDHPRFPGMYGAIEAVENDEQGRFKNFKLAVYNPADREYTGDVITATLEDIQ